MAAGYNVSDADRQGIKVEGGPTEHVEDFPYLQTVICENGRMDTEIGRRLAIMHQKPLLH